MGLNFLTTDSEIFEKRLEYEREVSAIESAFKIAQLELEQKRDKQTILLHSVYQQQKEIIKKNKDQIPVFVKISKSEKSCSQDSGIQEYEIKYVNRFNNEVCTVEECATQTKADNSRTFLGKVVLCRRLDSFEIVGEDYDKFTQTLKNDILNDAQTESDDNTSNNTKPESTLSKLDDEISNNIKLESNFDADDICAHITSSPVKSPRNSINNNNNDKDNDNDNNDDDIDNKKPSVNLFDDFGSSLDLSNSDTPSDDDCFETDSDDQRNMIKLQETDEFTNIDNLTENLENTTEDYLTKCEGWQYDQKPPGNENNNDNNDDASTESYSSSIDSIQKDTKFIESPTEEENVSKVSSKISKNSVQSQEIVAEFLVENIDSACSEEEEQILKRLVESGSSPNDHIEEDSLHQSIGISLSPLDPNLNEEMASVYTSSKSDVKPESVKSQNSSLKSSLKSGKSNKSPIKSVNFNLDSDENDQNNTLNCSSLSSDSNYNLSLLSEYTLCATIETSEVYFPSSAIQLLDGNILVCSAGTKTLCIFDLNDPGKVVSRYPPKWNLDSAYTLTLPDTVIYDNFVDPKEDTTNLSVHPKIFVRDQDKLMAFDYNLSKKELFNPKICENYSTGDIEDCRDLKICRSHKSKKVCVVSYDKVLKNMVYWETENSFRIIEEISFDGIFDSSEGTKIDYFDFFYDKNEVLLLDYKYNRGTIIHVDLSTAGCPTILRKIEKLDVSIGKGLSGIALDKYNNFVVTSKRPLDNRMEKLITVFRNKFLSEEDCNEELVKENIKHPVLEFRDGRNAWFDKNFSKMKPISVWFNTSNGKMIVCDVSKQRSRVLILDGAC